MKFKDRHAVTAIWLLALVFMSGLAWGADPTLPVGDEDPPVPEDLVIEANPEESDAQIEARLESIFSELDSLVDVDVEVNAGVVTLFGTVPETGDREAALALAERTEGVVYVRDRIERQVDVGSRLRPAAAKAQEMWAALLRLLPLIMVALTMLVAMIFAGRLLASRVTWWKRFGLGALGVGLLQRGIRLLFVAVGVVIALEILDATALAGALLGFAGVVGIALGFAFRNIVENYLAGILLGTRNPFAPGDVVEMDGRTGKVIRLTSRDTVLMTLDGNHLRIPNRKVMDSELINFTRNPRRRFDFAVGISVEQDLAATRQLGLDTILEVVGVLTDPKPWGVIEELGDSTVNLRFYAWIDQRESDFLRSRSEAIRKVKETFDEVGIEMPEPIYRVHLTEKSAPEKGATEPRPKTPVASDDSEETVAPDDTLDRQIELSERNSGEENLLKGD